MERERGLAVISIIAETPLHTGTGCPRGGLDFPLVRDEIQDQPFISGARLAEALGESGRAAGKSGELLKAALGSGSDEDKNRAWARFEDAKILLFPLRSACGVFGFVTCIASLLSLKGWIDDAGRGELPLAALGTVGAGQALLCPGSDLALKNDVVLEEYRFSVSVNPALVPLARWLAEIAFPVGQEYEFWRAKLERSLVVLSDGDFNHYMKVSSEVLRVLNDSQRGGEGPAVWREHLPADTILVSRLTIDLRGGFEHNGQSPRDLLSAVEAQSGGIVWFGPEKEAGRGLCRMRCLPLEGARSGGLADLAVQ